MGKVKIFAATFVVLFVYAQGLKLVLDKIIPWPWLVVVVYLLLFFGGVFLFTRGVIVRFLEDISEEKEHFNKHL